jgi:hypothetical protein
MENWRLWIGNATAFIFEFAIPPVHTRAGYFPVLNYE